MSSTIPITLQPVPVPVAVDTANINELLSVICQFISASVNVDVSFYQQGPIDPTTFATQLFFNTAQQMFKQWDASLGKYVAVSQYQPGDIMPSFIAGDTPLLGWVVCDGRLLTAIQGISQSQLSVLQQLFGITGSLPTIPTVFSGTVAQFTSVYVGQP